MIQLKIRTEYSFGKTYAPIPRIIERLTSIGCTAAGIVDNNTWGHVAWVKACKAANIKPLLGLECVVSDNEVPQTMWFLAKTNEGLKELYRAASLSHHQPIVDRSGSIARLYKRDVMDMSKNIEIFSGDVLDTDFLNEICAYHDLSPSSRILNISKQRMEGPYMEVSDNAYAFEEDRETFELTSRAGMKQTPQYILPSLVASPWPDMIIENCSAELPSAPMVRASGDLLSICLKGGQDRRMVARGRWNDTYAERLQYELELIKSKDFESYFLIVADMVRYAKKHMLVGPSRGSAAGSLVCYLAGITEIDPIPAGLYFERFIDVSRTDLPDIDLDFPDDKRHLVFEYMAEKYGRDNVAHIGTVSRFKPKSALVQICKDLNIPPSATGAVKAAIIERNVADVRFNFCLADTFADTQAGKAFIESYPLAHHAALIEGHASHSGVHAAGLLVCNDEITNYATVDANGIAHIEKGAAEQLGLLKIDVLGLRTLSILADSGIDIDWYNLPLDDAATFELFNSGRLCGIFQFEGGALRGIAREIRFDTIAEIDAVTALARPGPLGGGVTEKWIKRKNGASYPQIHPLIDIHMADTFGLPVYQEQTLAIVRHVGGFSWKDTSTVRKAISKTLGKELLESFWERFKEGAAANGVEEKEAKATWNMIVSMGAWQMNKAHTYSYAVISYWTAYLKANHPLAFAAANLRNAKDEESAVDLLREMVREGIEYIPFDIELSEQNWSVKDGKLVGGFMSLRGIGESKAAKLIEARKEGKLTDKDRQTCAEAPNVFMDLFPLHAKYASYYESPESHDILSPVSDLVDIQSTEHKEERVFIAELMHKQLRNHNEEDLVKKRKGKKEIEQLDFVDVRFRDDTGSIGGRISRFDFHKIGKQLLDEVEVGAHLLIRAKFFNGIRYAFVSKWKRLDK